MPDSNKLAIEGALAAAHRSLRTATSLASQRSDLGLHDDLQMIELEVERLAVDLLRSGKPRRLRHAPLSVSTTEETRAWLRSPPSHLS